MAQRAAVIAGDLTRYLYYRGTAMSRTHTVPNNVSVQLVETAAQHVRPCLVVRRDREVLAIYLPEWTSNCIPTIAQLQRDARWNKGARP